MPSLSHSAVPAHLEPPGCTGGREARGDGKGAARGGHCHGGRETRGLCCYVHGLVHLLDVLQRRKLVGEGERGEGGPTEGWLVAHMTLDSHERSHVDHGIHVRGSKSTTRAAGIRRGQDG